MKKYIKLMRIHHYVKNLLVFVALICSGQLFDPTKTMRGLIGFFTFCLISSVVYIINDIRDREKDRNHPIKKNRPIACGSISIRKAWGVTAVLFSTAVLGNLAVFHPISTLLLLIYFILNLAYSFGLKNIPLLDVTILVSGFLIRIMYGAYITGISVSGWLYLTVVSMSFYFAFGKRRNEAKQLGAKENTRSVLKHYPSDFLNKNMNMCMTLANTFYALWTMDEATVRLYDSRYLMLTVPIVFLITMKYSLDVEGDYDGDPVEVLIKDRVLLILCALYLVVMFTVLYL